MGAIIGTGEYVYGSFTAVTGNCFIATSWFEPASTSGTSDSKDIFTLSGNNTSVKLTWQWSGDAYPNNDLELRVRVTAGGSSVLDTTRTIISNTSDFSSLFNPNVVTIIINRNDSISNQYDYTIKYNTYDASGTYARTFTGNFTSSSDLTFSSINLPDTIGGGNGGYILGKFYLDVRSDNAYDVDTFYNPTLYYHKWYYLDTSTSPYTTYTPLMGDDFDNSFPDGTPIYYLNDNGDNFVNNDSNASGADLSASDGPFDSYTLTEWGPPLQGVPDTISVQSTFYARPSVGGEASLSVNSIVYGENVLDVEDYVATTSALYVDVGYHDDDYVQNDPYVEFGYVEDYDKVSASVTRSSTIEEISVQSAVASIGGNAISAELDVSGQGAITITAKATLASEVDFATQTAMSVSAGLVFSQTTSIAADTAQTQTVGLIFSQSTDLAADFASTQLGGNLIVASATPASDAQISADTDVLQGGILNATATFDISILPGYRVNGTASVASDAQFSSTAESIPFIDETFESDFALSATGANNIDAELDVTGQGAITITAKATTGSDVELAGQFQFSAIAELDTVAESTISAQTTSNFVGGLVFSQITSVASDFATTQSGAVTTGITESYAGDSEFAIDTEVLIGGILNAASDFAVADVEPSLFVGGISNIFQGTSTVVTVGSYLYDVPLTRRLTVPADTRSANILQETGILGVKSESRINTIITETRGLKVPQDNRTHKIFDGSL